jgi:hypothetical protein
MQKIKKFFLNKKESKGKFISSRKKIRAVFSLEEIKSEIQIGKKSKR